MERHRFLGQYVGCKQHSNQPIRPLVYFFLSSVSTDTFCAALNKQYCQGLMELLVIKLSH